MFHELEQEISMVHYRIHNSSPLVHILSQINSTPSHPPSLLMLFPHLELDHFQFIVSLQMIAQRQRSCGVLRNIRAYLLTYLLTYLLHGAESFLRS
jgi:hypothetical protein